MLIIERCMVWILFFFCLLSSCCQKDHNYFCRQGEVLAQQLICEFHDVKTLSDLLARQERLESVYYELALLAVQAKQSGCEFDENESRTRIDDLLFEELERILKIPGAEVVLEQCQMRGISVLSRS